MAVDTVPDSSPSYDVQVDLFRFVHPPDEDLDIPAFDKSRDASESDSLVPSRGVIGLASARVTMPSIAQKITPASCIVQEDILDNGTRHAWIGHALAFIVVKST
jgi:hypothetical protein